MARRGLSVFQPGEGGIIAQAMDFGDHGAHGIETHTARHLIILEDDLVARLVACFTRFFNRDDVDPDPKSLAFFAHARFPFAIRQLDLIDFIFGDSFFSLPGSDRHVAATFLTNRAIPSLLFAGMRWLMVETVIAATISPCELMIGTPIEVTPS